MSWHVNPEPSKTSTYPVQFAVVFSLEESAGGGCVSNGEEGYYPDRIIASIYDGGNRGIANPVLTTIPVTSLESTIAETRVPKRYKPISNGVE